MIASQRKISCDRTAWFIRLRPPAAISAPRAGQAVIA
jgi:hypothetical protein